MDFYSPEVRERNRNFFDEGGFFGKRARGVQEWALRRGKGAFHEKNYSWVADAITVLCCLSLIVILAIFIGTGAGPQYQLINLTIFSNEEQVVLSRKIQLPWVLLGSQLFLFITTLVSLFWQGCRQAERTRSSAVIWMGFGGSITANFFASVFCLGLHTVWETLGPAVATFVGMQFLYVAMTIAPPSYEKDPQSGAKFHALVCGFVACIYGLISATFNFSQITSRAYFNSPAVYVLLIGSWVFMVTYHVLSWYISFYLTVDYNNQVHWFRSVLGNLWNIFVVVTILCGAALNYSDVPNL